MSATAKKKAPKSKRPSKNGKPKNRVPKQQYLPQMEPPHIPILNKLADDYRDKRDRRMALTKEEIDAADKLDLKMKEHGLTEYEYDGYVVKLVQSEKVTVKRKTPAEYVHEAAAKRERNGEE